MDGFDVGETRKVSRVECQDALDFVDMHGGNETGVMHLDSGGLYR